ncbi:HAD family hydrolase [Candidatus Woesearchaeota archaeon]|nr:HAD family hydrolase [Candidatus Woesearchaeota archaeon]
MTKLIIFDFWGTLVENGVFPSPTQQARSILGVRMSFVDFVIRFEKAFMLDKFPNLREAFTKVCEEFGIEPSEELLDDLVGMWNKNMLLAKPFSEVDDTLAELQKTYTLAIISNADCFSVEQVLDKYGLRKYFKSMRFSYQEGMLKLNPELFKHVLNDTNMKPEDAIMVGDSIHSDMLSAKQVGIAGILVDRKNKREFDYKVQRLDMLPQVIQAYDTTATD